MSTSTLLTNEQLSLLNSLTNSERVNLLSKVEKSLLPSYLGQLYEWQQTEKLITPLRSFSPHEPHPKQRLFLGLTCREALYGGAAGGGKSDALLMGALQYIHVPRYSALILRTDYGRLMLSGGLVPRSHQWLFGRAEWNGNDRRWTFPNGSTIQFGYLQNVNDKYRYGSSEYQYIAFDELTEFREEDYLFMFSRLRMTEDIAEYGVPYRIRGASNPGGKGHEWVKNRFITQEAESDLKNNSLKSIYWKQGKTGRYAFVPAKIRDNPTVDPVRYEENLSEMPPVLRERLMNGDWTILPSGLIKSDWLRYFTMTGRNIHLLSSKVDIYGNTIHTDEILHTFFEGNCRRIITIDTAGGVKDIMDNAKEKKLSYTAVGVWDYKRLGLADDPNRGVYADATPQASMGKALLLRQVYRAKGLLYSDMKQLVRRAYKEWSPVARVRVENKALGTALQNDLQSEMPIELISSGTIDKVQRATPFLNMLEKGQVYLPQGENSWRHSLEAEWLSWQGMDGETDDQIDIGSYAAIELGNDGGITKCAVDPREALPIAPKRRGWF